MKLYLAVVERIDDGERLYSDAAVSEILATVLESLLDDESHTLECGSSLLAEVDDALGGVAVGTEDVDE